MDGLIEPRAAEFEKKRQSWGKSKILGTKPGLVLGGGRSWY